MTDTTQPVPSLTRQWTLRLEAARHIPTVLRIVWASGPSVVAANLAARTLAALLPVAMLAVSKWIVDGVAGRRPAAEIWPLVAAEFGLAAVIGVTSRFIGFLDALIADRFSRHLSIQIMEHASRLDLLAYEDPEFHDQLERARVQATDRIGMVHATGALLQQMLLAASLCASVFWFSPWLLAVLIVCVVPAFLGESHFAFLGYSLNFSQAGIRREIDYLRVLGSSKESAKELRLFGLADYFTDRFRRLSNTLYDQNRTLALRRFLAGAVLSLVTSAGYYGAYFWIVWRAVEGEISVGTLIFLAGAISGASSNLQGIFSTFASIADQALFLTDLVRFLGVKPKIRAAEQALPAPRPIKDGFVFENVGFHYPGRDRQILQGINLRIEPGERLALVGENGQGKTTLVKLLTRLYDPTSGRILLEGNDLRDYDPVDLAREIGVIFQDFVRFDMTARENVAMGRIEQRDAPGFGERIEEAARKSLADGVIAKLPAGLEQMLGRRFAGGVDLSGGEWQKIALARAYLRDAQLLVLDEPTAALDARSELEIFHRFADLTRGKMALLISHRFSTVRMADRILVLDGGRITEEGTHDDLIERMGLYAAMFEMQAASYR